MSRICFVVCLFAAFGIADRYTFAQEMEVQGASYTAYGEWSECSVSCGGGLSYRVKECVDLSGEEDCEKSERKECNTQLCETEKQDAADKEYLEYSEWTQCTVTCGGGTSFRTRECTDLDGGLDCEKAESRPCNKQPCRASAASRLLQLPTTIPLEKDITAASPSSRTGASYTAYGEWSECSASCGGGFSYRVKECDDLSGEEDCEKAERKKCNTQLCEVEKKDKEYLEYSEWTQCTVTCGGGTSFRTRECTGLDGGPDCEKAESRPCNEQPCRAAAAARQLQLPTPILQEKNNTVVSPSSRTGFLDNIVEGEVGGRKIPDRKAFFPPTTESTTTSEKTTPIPTKSTTQSTLQPTTTSTTEPPELKQIKGCKVELRARTEARKFVPTGFMTEGEYSCEWIVKAPEGNQIVAQIHYYNQRSCCDKFIIYDGERILKSMEGKASSENKFTTTTNSIRLTFSSQKADGFRNFRIWYKQNPVDTEKLSIRPRASPKPTSISKPSTSFSKAQCDETLSADKNIKMFNKRFNVRNEMYECAWQISALRGERVKASITYFSTDKCCSAVEVYDGEKLIKKYRGNAFPRGEEFITESSTLIVLFRNTVRNGQSRITVLYRSLSEYGMHSTKPAKPIATTIAPELIPTRNPNTPQKTKALKCGHNAIAETHLQQILGPVLRGNKPYKCEWKVSAPKGRTIKALAHINNDGGCCDSVMVFDGYKLIGNINATGRKQMEYFTKTNSLRFIYRSRGGYGARRFRAYFKLFNQDDTKCGRSVTAVSHTRRLESPHFVEGKRYDCAWRIAAPIGRRLHIRLYYHNTALAGDVMKVKDGDDTIDRLSVNTYSETKYVTKSNVLILQFTSDGTSSGTRRFFVYYMLEPMIYSMPYVRPRAEPEPTYYRRQW